MTWTNDVWELWSIHLPQITPSSPSSDEDNTVIRKLCFQSFSMMYQRYLFSLMNKMMHKPLWTNTDISTNLGIIRQVLLIPSQVPIPRLLQACDSFESEGTAWLLRSHFITSERNLLILNAKKAFFILWDMIWGNSNLQFSWVLSWRLELYHYAWTCSWGTWCHSTLKVSANVLSGPWTTRVRGGNRLKTLINA